MSGSRCEVSGADGGAAAAARCCPQVGLHRLQRPVTSASDLPTRVLAFAMSQALMASALAGFPSTPRRSSSSPPANTR
eukprot:2569757-Rhodomonas_salina.2